MQGILISTESLSEQNAKYLQHTNKRNNVIMMRSHARKGRVLIMEINGNVSSDSWQVAISLYSPVCTV